MKLSELKAFIARVEADAKAQRNTDPSVSFWLTTEVEKDVRTPGRHTIFTDVVPGTSDPVGIHRITAEGDTRGDYSIPLYLYKRG